MLSPVNVMSTPCDVSAALSVTQNTINHKNLLIVFRCEGDSTNYDFSSEFFCSDLLMYNQSINHSITRSYEGVVDALHMM